MSTALIILLLTTTAGDADNALAPAVVRATREAVGADAQIYIRTSSALPSDETAASLGTELHADGVVELSWAPPDGLRANIHALRQKSGLWTDLEIHFRPADLPVERARTVGFAVASMFPEHMSEPPSTTVPGPPQTSAPGAEAPRTTGPPNVTAAPVATRAVGASLIGGFGVGDSGGGMGGALDFRWTFAPPFGLRIGGALRIGEIPAAQINTRFVAGSLGMVWDAWEAPGRQGGVDLRLDAIFARLDFTRLAGDDETDQQSKWMPGTALILEGSWFFVEGAAVVGGGGVEVLFGRTAIRVGDRTFTTMSPTHPVAELGLRARF